MLTEQTTSTRETATPVEKILRTLLRRVGTIVLVMFVVTGASLGFSLLQPPTYEASIKILVGQKSTADTSLSGDVSGLQELTLTVARLVPTTPVAQAVVEQLNLPKGSAGEVLRNMSVQQDPGTMVIDVSYKASDPERAQQIANAIGQVVSKKISEVSLGANAITARVWEPATLPQTPVSPDPVRNSIIALVLGGLLGVALAFLLESVDDSWDSPEEVEEISAVPTFGVIPRFETSASKKVEALVGKKEGEQYVARFQFQRQAQKEAADGYYERLVALLDPVGAASEAYRSLRTSLLYAVADAPPTVILITSSGSADGKSTTCANLAVVLAQAGKKTLLIDSDLRDPSLHRIFGVPNVNGLVNVLSGEYNLLDVCTEPLPELKMLSTGPIPPNPAELLSSDRFAELIGQVRPLFDYVLIDSPPTRMVSDPMIIATQADAVLLVLDSRGTSKGSLRKAMRNLEAVGANVLGTVMNKTPKAETGRYSYSY